MFWTSVTCLLVQATTVSYWQSSIWQYWSVSEVDLWEERRRTLCICIGSTSQNFTSTSFPKSYCQTWFTNPRWDQKEVSILSFLIIWKLLHLSLGSDSQLFFHLFCHCFARCFAGGLIQFAPLWVENQSQDCRSNHEVPDYDLHSTKCTLASIHLAESIPLLVLIFAGQFQFFEPIICVSVQCFTRNYEGKRSCIR